MRQLGWDNRATMDTKKGVSHLRGCETPVDEAFRIIVRVWLTPFSLVRN